MCINNSISVVLCESMMDFVLHINIIHNTIVFAVVFKFKMMIIRRRRRLLLSAFMPLARPVYLSEYPHECLLYNNIILDFSSFEFLEDSIFSSSNVLRNFEYTVKMPLYIRE